MAPASEAESRSLIHPVTENYLRRFTSKASLTLEAGCGPGQYKFAVNGDYLGFDISLEEYRPGMKRNVDLVADARVLPFTQAAFDLVFFSNTFHYFQNASEILQNCYKLLKASGRLLIFDYSKTTLQGLDLAYKTSSPGFNAIMHTAATWEELLIEAGFESVDLYVTSPPWKRAAYKAIRLFAHKTTAFSWVDNQSAAIVAYGTKRK